MRLHSKCIVLSFQDFDHKIHARNSAVYRSISKIDQSIVPATRMAVSGDLSQMWMFSWRSPEEVTLGWPPGDKLFTSIHERNHCIILVNPINHHRELPLLNPSITYPPSHTIIHSIQNASSQESARNEPLAYKTVGQRWSKCHRSRLRNYGPVSLLPIVTILATSDCSKFCFLWRPKTRS